MDGDARLASNSDDIFRVAFLTLASYGEYPDRLPQLRDRVGEAIIVWSPGYGRPLPLRNIL